MLVSLLVWFAVFQNIWALHGFKPARWPRRGNSGQAESFEKLSMSPSLLDINDPQQMVGYLPVSWSDNKQSYYAVISAGNISFRVSLDTGSSDLWITSSSCTSSACHSVPKYPLSYESPSFVSVNNNNTAFDVGFDDGTVATGYVARETLRLSNLTIANQTFGLVTSSNVTMGSDISGLLGLGFPRLSTIFNSVANATPVFSSLAQQGLVNYPLFGLSLTRNTSGSLVFGAIDASVVQNLSNIEWNEVVAFSPFGSESNTSSYLQWAIPLSNILVNGSQLTPLPTYPNAYSNTSIALLDVGTPGIYGPFQDVSRMFSNIDGSRLVDQSGQWALPCDISETMSFVFGEQNFTLQPSDYIIGPASGNPDLCLSWPRASAPSSDGIDWQLGAAFLRTVYSIFSYGIDSKEPPMIGLYPLNNASAPVESTGYVASFLSAESATLATTLPNFVLSLPTHTTPTYAFNTSVPASIGEIVSSELATSTYSPILANPNINATAIPNFTPSPTLQTLIITDNSGEVVTTTSTASMASISLGVPPGWTSDARASCVPLLMTSSFSIFFALFLLNSQL